MVGSILGLLLLGPLGIIMRPFLGAAAGEFLTGQSLEQSLGVCFNYN
ncbi:DUF456 family protein [Desulfofarcimen acetoxidans]|nr:DUF456 family protein [Desulfofarcimen acetoxidans]